MCYDEQIQHRWGLSLPQDYLRFLNDGLLVNETGKGLCLSRFFWLPIKEIANADQFAWPEYKIRQLIPFARTLGGGHFAWYMEGPMNVWVAECPRDSDFAEGIASNFVAFVYRSLLTELSDSWLVGPIVGSPDEAKLLLRAMIERAAPYLPSSWAGVLRACGSNELVPADQKDEYRFISKEEANRIIQRDLSFPMLNQSFRQHEE